MPSYVEEEAVNSVTDSLIRNPFHYSLPVLLKDFKGIHPTDSVTLPHHSNFPWWKRSVKNKKKKKNPVGKPNDPREGPVIAQKELMFVLVTTGIPHLCTVLSLLLLVCIMYSLLQLSLIIPAK